MRASGSHSITLEGRAAGRGAARRLPGRRPVAVHGSQPAERPVPRLGLARHRRGRVRARRPARPHRRGRAGEDAGGRVRDRPRRGARRDQPARRRSSTSTTRPIPTDDGTEEEVTAVFAEGQAAKTFVSEAAMRVVDRALALSGGAGYLNELTAGARVPRRPRGRVHAPARRQPRVRVPRPHRRSACGRSSPAMAAPAHAPRGRRAGLPARDAPLRDRRHAGRVAGPRRAGRQRVHVGVAGAAAGRVQRRPQLAHLAADAPLRAARGQRPARVRARHPRPRRARGGPPRGARPAPAAPTTSPSSRTPSASCSAPSSPSTRRATT